MLMLSRICDHLSHLGFGDFISEDSAHSFALSMDLQHNPRRFDAVHGKEPLQDVDHEFHGRVVVIDQQYLILRRALELRRRFLDHQAGTFFPAFNVTHELSVYRAHFPALQAAYTKAATGSPCRQIVSVYFNKYKQMLERPSR